MTEETTGRAVVVGVDGTALSRDALVFALGEGDARGVTVRVVSAWTFGTTLHDASDGTTYDAEVELTRGRQDASIAEALAQTEARPVIEQAVVHGESGPVLVEEAQDALMLVVGSGRKGVLARAFLGSSSAYCVRHATVPVVVVPDSACV